MNLDKLLNNINYGAMFFIGLDSDEVLVSLAAGGDVPFSAAWDSTGYRPYEMSNEEEYHPLKRASFMEFVKDKKPLNKIK